MVKTKVKLPAGFECKDGTCLEKPLEFDLDIPERKPIVTQTPPAQIDMGQQVQQMAPPPAPPTPEPHNHSQDAPKKITHEDIKEIIPAGINAMKCPGGNCGNEMLKNPIQTKKYKTCPNGDCEANTVPKGSDYCPYCTKSIDPEDDLDDGIDLTSEDDEE